jgi:chromosome segregation ATPase
VRDNGGAAAELDAAAEARIKALLAPVPLRQRVDRLGRRIADAECDAGGSLPEVEAELEGAERAAAAVGDRAARALALHAALRSACRRRVQRLTEVDQAVEELVSAKFNAYMRRKGHLGRLRVDRAARALTLRVHVAGGAGGAAAAAKDLKQLSGGERSFATVAFALALGAETAMPFRAMDEFDVFMDAVNRRAAVENLLSFAAEQSDLQFVLLTPQDVAAVGEARRALARAGTPLAESFVRVVQMARPRA